MNGFNIRSAVAAALLASVSFGGLAAASESVEAQIEAIQEKYRAEFDALRHKGEQLAADAPSPTAIEGGVGIDFDVKWERTTIKFDIPEVVMKTREFKLHLPQFRMKRTSIKWDNPEFFWAVTKVGEYPCFKGLKWYSCDIKTKVPQVRMVRREAKFDIPDVFWDITSFKMDIPEFFSKRVEIKLHLPQFYAKDVKGEISVHKAKAEAISGEASALAERQKAEITSVVSADLVAKRDSVAGQFDSAIVSLEAAIASVRQAGANPEAMVSDEGTENLVAKLEDLRVQRAETMAMFDSKIDELQSPAVAP